MESILAILMIIGGLVMLSLIPEPQMHHPDDFFRGNDRANEMSHLILIYLAFVLVVGGCAILAWIFLKYYVIAMLILVVWGFVR